MAKFFFLDRESYVKAGQLLQKCDTRDFVVCNEYGGYTDIVRYSPKYDNLVFLTCPSDRVYGYEVEWTK